ncbi:MAG: tRNA (adenosine(37)-N6)-dimethylallyltransferase MiaA [Acidobacteriota bacterium]
MVVGATASGKTRLASEIACRVTGEVVNADALQLYRELSIGVAKPDPAMLARAPHHLFEDLSVREPSSVGRFVARARAVLEEIWRHGHVPVVAGGTGLYVDRLLRGIDDVPAVPAPVRQRIRSLVERRGAARAHRLLAHVDPTMAGRLAPADRQRIGRGLEVYFGTGRRLSTLQSGAGKGIDADVRMVGIRRTRVDLDARIRDRVRIMWGAGLLDEARRLRSLGLEADVRARKPIGYAEAFDVLDGRLSEGEAVEGTAVATRQLAKRQDTWFRRMAIRWIDASPGAEVDPDDALSALG